MQTGAATLENSKEVPQEIKNRNILGPSNWTTRYLSKGYRCALSKGRTHPSVYSSTIDNGQSMERAQMSIEGWAEKEDVVYIHNGIVLGNQKEWHKIHTPRPGSVPDRTEPQQIFPGRSIDKEIMVSWWRAWALGSGDAGFQSWHYHRYRPVWSWSNSFPSLGPHVPMEGDEKETYLVSITAWPLGRLWM